MAGASLHACVAEVCRTAKHACDSNVIRRKQDLLPHLTCLQFYVDKIFHVSVSHLAEAYLCAVDWDMRPGGGHMPEELR